VSVDVKDPEGDSKNPTASCTLVRMAPADAAKVEAKAKAADASQRAAVWGKEGVWFDYLDALQRQIEKNPKDESLLKKRTAALKAQGFVWGENGRIEEGTAGTAAPAGGASEGGAGKGA
jgi:hypothetical protein